MRRALALGAAAALALAGCGDDGGASDTDALPQTWTIPASVCTDLDLTAVLVAAVPDPDLDPRELGADVEGDRASCAAGTGGVEVEVSVRTSNDPDEHEQDWDDARRRAQPSSVWESIGPIETASPAPADWGQRAESVRFSTTRISGDDDLADAAMVLRVDTVEDDNLVVLVSVNATSGRGESATGRLADRVAEAALAGVPDALER